APARIARIQVRCVSRAGFEESLVVPLQSLQTVGDLLQLVRQRVRRVPAADVAELELDGPAGGRLYEEDELHSLLNVGDTIRSCPSEGFESPAAPEFPAPPTRTTRHLAGQRVGHRPAWHRPGRSQEHASENYVQQAAEEFDEDGQDLAMKIAIVSLREEASEDGSATPPPPGSCGVDREGTFSSIIERGEREFLGSESAGGATSSTRRSIQAWQMPEREDVYGSRAPPPLPAEDPRAHRRGAPLSDAYCLNDDDLAAMNAARSRSPRRSVTANNASWTEEDSKWPALLKAVYDGDMRRAQELLRRGADVNCVGSGQRTPIYYAIRFETVDIARMLLRHPDIDLTLEMKAGKGWCTPLEAVKQTGAGTAIYKVFQEEGMLTPDGEPVRRPRNRHWHKPPEPLEPPPEPRHWGAKRELLAEQRRQQGDERELPAEARRSDDQIPGRAGSHGPAGDRFHGFSAFQSARRGSYGRG
ncbi:unnamed protein product, partial [Polarella glacialis]